MIIKTKYKFGDIFFLKNDPEQNEYCLIAVIQEPGVMSFRLRGPDGDVLEVYDFEISEEINTLKVMGVNKHDEEKDE